MTDAAAGAMSGREHDLAVAVAAHGAEVARRELAAAERQLGGDGELSPRERAVLRAMAARIVAGVLPGPRAVAAAEAGDRDVAAVLGALFPVEA